MLCVRYPGRVGSSSPVCPLFVLCHTCGVLGLFAPVHRCACSVCCAACTVSWALWLLFTSLLARCAVLRVRRLGPLGSCSPVGSLGVLCWGLHVRGVAAGRTLVHPDGGFSQPAGAGFAAGRALVQSGRWLFIAGRRWVPSERALVDPDGGCSVAGRGGVRCRARTCPSGRRLVLLGTCSRAVVHCVLCAHFGFAAPGGRCCLAPVRLPWLWLAAYLSRVPRGPAWCAVPRPVPLLSVLWLAFLTAWCLSASRRLALPALLGGCAGLAEAARDPGSLCLPLAHAEAGALGLLRIVPVLGPAMGLSKAGPSGVSLGLRAVVGVCGRGH